MGDTDKISLKLLVDKENNKVLFAEAGTYFVKVLLCFLSYPIGAVSRNSYKKSMVGCIDALYKSVDALDMQYFQTEACKDMLVRPTWACSTSTKIHYHSKIYGKQKCCGVKHKITPVDESEIFMITDDLHVKKVSMDTGVQILSQMGITDVSVVEEKIISVTEVEVMDLLRRSILSKTPITDVFLNPKDDTIKNTRKKIKTEPLEIQFLSLDQTVRDSIEKISLKLLVRKSQNKVVYAVANAEFVDLLFSILDFPWETIVDLFCGCSSIGSMDNLYKSEDKLCNEYPKQFTKDKKKPFNPNYKGSYVKAITTIFMVTDELTVEPFSLVSSISFINKLDVPLNDLEERIATFGEQEALSIVKASLTTTTPLTKRTKEQAVTWEFIYMRWA